MVYENDIKFPNGITVIGEKAYKNNHNLKNVVIPPTVTKIGTCIL